jgi:nucleotide-binding universal stress UspA family protein
MQETAKGTAPIAIRNVMFATDLSYASAPAIPYAVEIAGVYGAKINVVHVKTGEWSREQEEQSDRLKEMLKGVPHEFTILSGGPTALKERGDAAGTILELAATSNTDLIVMGTHGRSGLGRVLIGSVAETVFREAPCPVLTVGPRMTNDPKWSLKIRQVLFATDLMPGSQGARPYAISLAQENRARLIITSVLAQSEDVAQIENRMIRLQALVPPAAGLWREPVCVVEIGDPAEKILDVAGAYHPDVIVMGLRPQSVGVATRLARPTAHRVIAGANCPVMTVRA